MEFSKPTAATVRARIAVAGQVTDLLDEPDTDTLIVSPRDVRVLIVEKN